MRQVWAVLAVLAVAHLVAAALTGAFLALTDRLSMERLGAARDVFMAETIAEQRARERREAAETAEAAASAALEDRLDGVPLEAVRLLDRRADLVDAASEETARLHRQVRDLQRQVREKARELADQQAGLEADKREFQELRDLVRRQESDEQFAKALSVIEGLKADEARATFDEMLARGDRRRVIAYLDAMEERGRAKVVAEFVAQDPDLAAGLLTDLELFGIEARTAARAADVDD